MKELFPEYRAFGNKLFQLSKFLRIDRKKRKNKKEIIKLFFRINFGQRQKKRTRIKTLFLSKLFFLLGGHQPPPLASPIVAGRAPPKALTFIWFNKVFQHCENASRNAYKHNAF